MAVRIQHDLHENSIYFLTFTCFKWKNLFELSDAWDAVYNWFDSLYKKNIRVTGYVIMPNHLHALLYFHQMLSSLNSIVGNGKRFMAYEIIKRLEQKKEIVLLEELYGYVTRNEKKKGQRHKVFEESFDAQDCYSRKFILQKLGYMHNNPIAKKWNLVNDIADYPHSSASFYEKGIKTYDKLIHVGEIW